MRILALALFLPLLVSTAMAAQPEPQDVELHFLPQPGDKMLQTVSFNMQMTMKVLPGQEMTEEQRHKLLEATQKMGKGMSTTMTMAVRTEAGEADAKGDYLLHVRGEGGQFKLHLADQPAQDVPNPMGELELDALTNVNKQDFEILRVKSAQPALNDPKVLDSLAHGVLNQAFGAMKGLEGRRLKIGDSVEMPLDLQMPMAQLPVQGHIKVSAIYTLTAIRRGIATFDTAIKMTMDMSGNEGQPKKVDITMSGSGAGKLEYRIADRLPLHHDMNATMHVEMQLPGQASTQMDMQMNTRSRTERYR